MSADDIALRLRSHQTEGVTSSDRYHLRNEAAAEIDKLRADLLLQYLRWRDAEVSVPRDGEEVLLYHCLGDSRRGMHAYDVATYHDGKWIFPWDRGELNPKPRWAIAWMPLPTKPQL